MLTDKYKPSSLDDVLGCKEIIKFVKGKLKSPEGVPHLLFYGKAGRGKTLIAELIAKELFQDDYKTCFYKFNASSKERGIDFVRNEVIELAKMSPRDSDYKIILMDEADHITPDAQACFRGIIPEYVKRTRFIFTANYPHKLIEPIRSRFIQFEFKSPEPEELYEYLTKIAKTESIPMTKEAINRIVGNCNGDIRTALNLLENTSRENSMDEEWEKMTIAKLKTLSTTAKVSLVFKADPDYVFGKIWDMVKEAEAWEYLPMLCDCQSKMNISVHKTIFLANLVDKIK